MSALRVTFASTVGRRVSGANPTRMPPPPSPPLTNLLLLLLLVLPLLSSSSFSSTLDEVKESLLEREGLRSLASFLSFDPSEDTEDVEEASLAMSSSRYNY